ncbi:uncharacterized protein ACN63O_006182 [Diretmus argenteus]
MCQGLSDCTMKESSPFFAPVTEPGREVVDVRDLTLQVVLCCQDRAACSLCLVIVPHLYINPDKDIEEEGSSGPDEEDASEKTGHPRVCDLDIQERIEECEVPRLSYVINHDRNEMELQVVDVFQRNIWKNVSITVLQGELNSYGAMLLWNLSAPCRLEAEVWPCHRTASVEEKSCKEMKGFRQQLLSNGTWKQNSKGHWENLGVFEDINLQLSPCVMVKVNGMETELGPFCFNDTSRWRWSLLVVAVVLLLCLTALIFYFLHDIVKISGRPHLVLLSPPDVQGVVSELVCKLGSLLLDRGFSVSVDQWSRTEQCSLGPLPWLHSQLLKLDHPGGRVVLVLTQKAWNRAEEWTRQQKEAQVEVAGLPVVLSPYSDVFTACLFLIQADKRLGRAGERFLLVDFESCPVRSLCSDGSLLELFQGLSVFHLPSQNQALLSELTVGRRGRGSDRKKWTEGGKRSFKWMGSRD